MLFSGSSGGTKVIILANVVLMFLHAGVECAQRIMILTDDAKALEEQSKYPRGTTRYALQSLSVMTHALKSFIEFLCHINYEEGKASQVMFVLCSFNAQAYILGITDNIYVLTILSKWWNMFVSEALPLHTECFLSPAYVVRREVMFSQASVCLSTFWLGGVYPVPGSFPGHWSQVLSGRYPSSMFFPRSLVPCPFWGVPQSQVLSQVTGPRSFLGLPQSWLWAGTPVLARSGWGTPSQNRMGYPPYPPSKPGQDGVPSGLVRIGYPSALARTRLGYPLKQVSMVYPLHPPARS